MSTVNSPAAAAAAAAEGLRAEAREILQLEADGGPIRDVLTRVQLFANNNSRSALACNLKGRMYKKVGDRIFPSSALSAKMYYETAEDAFDRAAQLAPACVTTAVAHANALAACSRYADAEKEFRRAVSVRRSVDPSFHNLISSDVPALTSSEDRKGEALLKARQDRLAFLGEVNKMIHQSEKELIGREFSHKAREEADALASKFPFSLRAQMLRIFLEREFARNLPQNINQEKFLERVFQKTTKLIDDFERSCILALFRAELLVDMKKYKEAREECQRGLMIAQPSNPCDEVLPPRNAEICVSDVRMQLSNLVDAISEQGAETEVSSLDSGSENVPLIKAEKSKDVQCKLQQMVIEKGPKQVNQRTNKLSQAVRHGIPRLFMNPILERKITQVPRPEQIMGDTTIPSDLVDEYALYCKDRSTCSKRKEVCHICVFDKRQYFNNKFEKSEGDWHCFYEHDGVGIGFQKARSSGGEQLGGGVSGARGWRRCSSAEAEGLELEKTMRRRSERGFYPEVRRCGFFPRGNDGYRADLPWLGRRPNALVEFPRETFRVEVPPGERTGIPAGNATTKRAPTGILRSTRDPPSPTGQDPLAGMAVW